jgi:methionine-rich copper-binding protein CopC
MMHCCWRCFHQHFYQQEAPQWVALLADLRAVVLPAWTNVGMTARVLGAYRVTDQHYTFSTKRVVMPIDRRSVVALTICVAVAGLLMVRTAEAHAVLVESNPALNGQVSGPDVPVQLRFNVRIDASRSRLSLLRSDGSTQNLELGKPTSADTLTSQVKGLAPGEYRLRWQVLASDGHLTRGEIPFTVTNS